MIKKHTALPAQPVREFAHGLAYQIARDKLAGIADIVLQCRQKSARYLPEEKTAVVTFLNQNYHIGIPGGEVTFTDSQEPVPLRDKILILHYFNGRSSPALSGHNITYKELHDGINYYPTFSKRAIEPVVNNFKDAPQKLFEIAAALGGKKSDFGDIAVTIEAFPKVPLTFVLWRGDKEFPPEGNIMFDSTIADYLPTEDITILCEMIAWKLVRLLKTGGDSPGKK